MDSLYIWLTWKYTYHDQNVYKPKYEINKKGYEVEIYNFRFCLFNLHNHPLSKESVLFCALQFPALFWQSYELIIYAKYRHRSSIRGIKPLVI